MLACRSDPTRCTYKSFKHEWEPAYLDSTRDLVQTVFGILGGIGAHSDDVAHMKRTADRLFGDEYVWSVLGAGRSQMPIASMGAAMGGNMRAALEDSLWDGPGRLAEGNAAQVRRVRSILEGLSLTIATPMTPERCRH